MLVHGRREFLIALGAFRPVHVDLDTDRGLQADVFEQAQELTEIGAAIGLAQYVPAGPGGISRAADAICVGLTPDVPSIWMVIGW